MKLTLEHHKNPDRGLEYYYILFDNLLIWSSPPGDVSEETARKRFEHIKEVGIQEYIKEITIQKTTLEEYEMPGTPETAQMPADKNIELRN